MVQSSARSPAQPLSPGAFHLLLAESAAWGPGAGLVEIPATGARLVGDTVTGARPAPDPGAEAVTFEPLARPGNELLLAICGPVVVLELDGLPAPRVAVLRPGARIRLGPGAPLFVDFFRPAPFVLAGPAEAASSCRLCRGPLEPGRRIHRCPCGALAHADLRADLAEGSEPLECAFGSCPACMRPLVSAAGYSHGGLDGR